MGNNKSPEELEKIHTQLAKEEEEWLKLLFGEPRETNTSTETFEKGKELSCGV